MTKLTRQTIVGGVNNIAGAEMQKIENFDELEDLTATTMRLRDVLDDICTQPISTRGAALEIGLRRQLLASAIEDAGQELITGVFMLPN
ncbi:hypothetical protein [Mesorhizobium sp. LNHC209A00]|uniref:hypothetical protein n=1 Tax=Mesorhizobium TaxID=68287 RepID=UPI0003CFA249|nr:hypothetical protein [Mesorhizobium sp. LNHC209A00]ESZ01869.1 hypothetical protein X738_01720 [Mesorhizobium sp. LNHC209A00]